MLICVSFITQVVCVFVIVTLCCVYFWWFLFRCLVAWLDTALVGCLCLVLVLFVLVLGFIRLLWIVGDGFVYYY